MRDHSLAVRQAVVTALRAASAISDIVEARVYGQQVPAEMPDWPSADNPAYVKMGGTSATPNAPSGINGASSSFIVHGFAQGPGDDLAHALKDAIIATLDEQTLTLSGGATLRNLRCTLAQVIADAASPSDFHAIVQFAATTAEPA